MTRGAGNVPASRVSMMFESGSPIRMRLDVWNRVNSRVTRLAIDPSQPALIDRLNDDLGVLERLEKFFVYPGEAFFRHVLHHVKAREFGPLQAEIAFALERTSQLGESASMLDEDPSAPDTRDPRGADAARLHMGPQQRHFVVLGVSDMSPQRVAMLRDELRGLRHGDEDVWYDVLVVPTALDALCAILVNPAILVVFISPDIPLGDEEPLPDLVSIRNTIHEVAHSRAGESPTLILADLVAELRPHIDRYLVTDESLPTAELGQHFDRVTYRLDNPHEIHMSILESVRKRMRTPFFDALKEYAERPIGNFHALPIARGHSVFGSKWIHDMVEFYGVNIFLAETSSTTGGLDSLLDPRGPIRDACVRAAECFGSDQTFFSTNGTSTSNKVIVQSLVRPGDIVLVDRNCHTSHHHAFVQTGALPLYLDAYRVDKHMIYGAVPLAAMKRALLELKQNGKIDRVKLVILTNCTFDGVVYHPLNVMKELLAIKPDLAFLWDEAWYAFATFASLPRHRTAMYAARTLESQLRSPEYRNEYQNWLRETADLDPNDIEQWVDRPLMADPDLARVRVYSSQSTHKSLSALRQGSMIHVRDEDFERDVSEPFHQAFNAHTSTSPNYQILASLDLARRQAELEGYAMVKEAYHIAFELRSRIATDPLLSKWFSVLEPADLIPPQYRQSRLEEYSQGTTVFTGAWEHDEFVLDPTRVTLRVAKTGLSGEEFRTDVLMDRFGVQVNKTSINSVLLIVTIGVQYGGLSFLLASLTTVAKELEQASTRQSEVDSRRQELRVERLTEGLPPLPDFSHFHSRFRTGSTTAEGDIRSAFFLGNDRLSREYVTLEEAKTLIEAGRDLVATKMIVPYPPGFPVLVPGQVVTREIVRFLAGIDVREIHGYEPDVGLAVFTEAALKDSAN